MSKDVKTQSSSKPVSNLLQGQVQGSAASSVTRSSDAKDGKDKDYVIVPSSSSPPVRGDKVVWSPKDPSLPLVFVQQLAKTIGESTAIPDGLKDRYLGVLINSTMPSLSETGGGTTVNYRRNFFYTGSSNFAMWYGTGASGLATSTGSIYNIGAFPASNATPCAVINLTDLVIGDDWGDLDPNATMINLKRIKVNMHCYPDNSAITFTGSGQTYPMPYALTKQRYRVMIVKDRFGKLGAANGAVAASLAEFGGAAVTSPKNFNAILFYPGYQAVPPVDPASIGYGSTEAISVHHSALSCPARYEVLYDETFDVSEQFWDPIAAKAISPWRGSVDKKIDLKCHIPVAYAPDGALGTTAYPLFNACTLLMFSNASVQTYWSYGRGSGATTSEIATPLADVYAITEFETVMPNERG